MIVSNKCSNFQLFLKFRFKDSFKRLIVSSKTLEEFLGLRSANFVIQMIPYEHCSQLKGKICAISRMNSFELCRIV